MIFTKPSLRLTALFFILAVKVSFAQPNTSPPQVFEEWAKQHVREKVYIHTDRAIYFKGDSIWFKAYLVTGSGNHLSGLSGALYVELIGNAGKVSQLKIPVVNGLAKGCFPTDFMLEEGSYAIRAYSLLMRNNANSFFQKNIYIGSQKAAHIFSSVVTSTSTENGTNKVVINYTNEKGEYISDHSLKYSVLEGKDTLKSGRSVTDKDGNLMLDFKATSGLTAANVKVEIDKEGKAVNTAVQINQASELDLQIFPEGGTIVEGLQCRMAVKCIGPDGYGKDIEGRIVDNNGETVTTFKTDHHGMGQFFLAPERGKTYTAVTNIKPTKVTLPAASPEGIVFSTYTNNPDTIMIRVNASPAMYAARSVWHLAGVSGNELVILNDFALNRPIVSLKLPCKELPAGVIQLTLFSDKYEPVAERLVFNYPQVTSSVKISDLKNTYKPREKVDVNLQSTVGGKPAVGSYSISVVDENFIRGDTEDDEQTILSTLLLSSDIKGHIEHPNYYFHDVDDNKRRQLDLLLRTQGYRSFNWKAIKGDKNVVFKPEGIGTVFSGYAKTLGGKPYPGAEVTILSLKAKLFEQTKADNLGRFSFPPVVLADSVKITFKASAPDKKKRLAIEIDSIPGFHPLTNDSYEYLYHNPFQPDKLNKVLSFKDEQQTKFHLGLAIDLKEVVVKDKGKKFNSDNFNGSGRADQVLLGDQFKSCANLSLCLAGMLNGVVFKSVTTDFGVVNAPFLTRGGSDALPMLLYWNGLKIDLQDYPNYLEQNVENPQDIVAIEILKNDIYTSIYGAQSRGVIVVSTRGNSLSGPRLNLSTRLFQPTGFNKVREFYVPKYNVSSISKRPDYRTTIYWNPSLVTSSEGSAPFTYFNSDALGSFRITVEGITPEGIMQRAMYRYKVER